MKTTEITKMLLCIALIANAEAASYSFGNAIHSSTSYNSDGSLLEEGTDVADVTFELGIFQEGGMEFLPDINNVASWEDNFISLNTVSYNPNVGGGFFTGGGSFGTSTGQIDNTFAPEGYRVYLWGYQSRTVPTDGSSTDWLLITGDVGGTEWSNSEWIVPDALTTNQGDLERQWTINTANTAIVGSILGSTGGGDIFDPQTLNPNDLQFAAVVIPEPKSITLILLAGLSILTRRRVR